MEGKEEKIGYNTRARHFKLDCFPALCARCSHPVERTVASCRRTRWLYFPKVKNALRLCSLNRLRWVSCRKFWPGTVSILGESRKVRWLGLGPVLPSGTRGCEQAVKELLARLFA